MTGFASAIPYIIGTIGTIVWGRVTDRTDERRWELFRRLPVRHGGLLLAGLTLGMWAYDDRHRSITKW